LFGQNLGGGTAKPENVRRRDKRPRQQGGALRTNVIRRQKAAPGAAPGNAEGMGRDQRDKI